MRSADICEEHTGFQTGILLIHYIWALESADLHMFDGWARGLTCACIHSLYDCVRADQIQDSGPKPCKSLQKVPFPGQKARKVLQDVEPKGPSHTTNTRWLILGPCFHLLVANSLSTLEFISGPCHFRTITIGFQKNLCSRNKQSKAKVHSGSTPKIGRLDG